MTQGQTTMVGLPLGAGHPPLIIAELSGNHNGDLDRALAIVAAAAAAGAHVLKLQTYTADTMTLDVDMPGFRIEDKQSLWHGQTFYELYEEAHTPWGWHGPIMERAKELGMICFSTPFDETAVDFLEGLGVPAYKIASFENTDVALIRKVAATGKPVLMSTGMATVDELELSVRTAREAGCQNLILLKCTSSYPASPEDSNILTLPDIREQFDCAVGLSDHTLGVGAAVAAVAHGAVVVEKHFTLSRAEGGVDAEFSMEPDEMRLLVEETTRAWQSLGSVQYGAGQAEGGSIQFRRSLYITRDVQAGEILGEKCVRCIRPGFGLAPKHLPKILGRRLSVAVKRGTPMAWDLLEPDEA
jgi:pseudaminic acid synthase